MEILKPKLGLEKNQRTTKIGNCSIIVLSQTPKERNKNVKEVLENYYEKKNIIIMALRPEEVANAENFLKDRFEIRKIYIESLKTEEDKEKKAIFIHKEIQQLCK
jgi:hypothetical protein